MKGMVCCIISKTIAIGRERKMTPEEEEFYYLINGREPNKMYNYHCLVCKYEEEVPEICVDELGDYE